MSFSYVGSSCVTLFVIMTVWKFYLFLLSLNSYILSSLSSILLSLPPPPRIAHQNVALDLSSRHWSTIEKHLLISLYHSQKKTNALCGWWSKTDKMLVSVENQLKEFKEFDIYDVFLKTSITIKFDFFLLWLVDATSKSKYQFIYYRRNETHIALSRKKTKHYTLRISIVILVFKLWANFIVAPLFLIRSSFSPPFFFSFFLLYKRSHNGRVII